MKKYGVDRDKESCKLLQAMPEEGFRLLFDVYHMQLCVYVVQLTDSFQLAEDIVQDFFVAFWERKYYRAILQIIVFIAVNLRFIIRYYKNKSPFTHLGERMSSL